MFKIYDELKEYAEIHHWPQWIIDYVLKWGFPIILFLIVLKFIYSGLQKIWTYRNTRILNKNVGESFRSKEVSDYTRYYVETRYQDVSPSEDDEPGRNFIVSGKGKLISLFLNEVFKAQLGNEKYFLILADSGMGKTTFLINLLIRYKNKIQYPWSLPKYKMQLIALGATNWEKLIEEMPEKENTVLLLDAFDEDEKASEDYKSRINYLLSLTETKFRAVILTCRSQFFASEKEEPSHTGYYTFGENGEYRFQKIHISPFNNRSVIRYLLKRYNILNPFKVVKLIKAFKIVKRCKSLMIRPMLLSYIDDLIKSRKEYFYSFEIYEYLVHRWISRESNKVAIIKKYESAGNYEKVLYEFMKKLAMVLLERKGNRIHKDEKFGIEGLELADYEADYQLSDKDIRGKSLLNRTSDGYFKFSHKSILEYFIAIHIIENNIGLDDIDISAYDTVKVFYYQMMIEMTFKSYPGTYTLLDGTTKEFPFLELHEIAEIKAIHIYDLSNTNPKLFKLFTRLETIYVTSYLSSNLYQIYNEFVLLISDHTTSNLQTEYNKKELIERRDKLFYESDSRKYSNYPYIRKRLMELEKDCIVIEPFLITPTYPEFESHLESIAGQIEISKKKWEDLDSLLSLIKSVFPSAFRLEKRTKNYIQPDMDLFLNEIEDLKAMFPYYKIIS